MSLAILISLCSKNQKWKTVDDCDFIDTFLDSWLFTHTHKATKFYLGYDENDAFFKDNIEDFKKRYPSTLFSFFELPKTCNGAPTRAWDILYEEALKDKDNEYFYQCGSDIFHMTIGFDSYLISVLDKNKGVGIAGGVDQHYWLERIKINQNGIIENGMVTRKHYETFGWFFPPDVKTWWSDDMITRIYMNSDNCFICTNISYRNTNRVGNHQEDKNRYKTPSTDSYIAKNWKTIADKMSEKLK